MDGSAEPSVVFENGCRRTHLSDETNVITRLTAIATLTAVCFASGLIDRAHAQEPDRDATSDPKLKQPPQPQPKKPSQLRAEKPQNGASVSQEPENIQELDQLAHEWWLRWGPERLEKIKNNVGKKNIDYLVHFPSGQPVAPYPSDITEGSRAQVLLVVAKGTTEVSLEITQCTQPQAFRTELEDVTETELSSGSEVAEDAFELRTVGAVLRCGPPSLDYTVEQKIGNVSGSSKSDQTLRVNPKYHLAAIVALGWDTARNKQFFLDQESTIQERRSIQGVSVYAGALWMIGGVDYHNMRPWNYVANLFVTVNVVSPLEDVATGISITPTGGIGIALGLSLHKRNILENGLEVDNELTGNGEIPTTRTWNGVRPGFFIGLTIDSNVYRALKSKSQ